MSGTSTKFLLREVISKWKFILAFTSLCIVLTLGYYYFKPLEYKSTVSFMVDNELERKNDQNLNDQSIYLAENAPNAVRLSQMIKSTEMLDYLIEKFSLYEQFRISIKHPMHHELVTNILKSKITVSNSMNSGMSITVSGKDRKMTADMANEMYVKLEEMINNYTISNLKRKIKIYDQVLDNSKLNLDRKGEELKILLDEFKSLVQENKKQRYNDMLYDIDMKLTFLSAQLNSVNQDLLRTIKNYEISVANTNKENLPNIKLINVALKDTSPALLLGLIYRLIAVAFFAFFSSILLLIFNQQTKTEEKTVYKVLRPQLPIEN